MRYPRFAVILISVICVSILATIASAADNFAPVLQSSTPVPGGSGTYIVQQGDTLFKIAVRFNMSTKQLADANGITNTSLIYPGQTLKIPGAGEVVPTAVPQSTGTYKVQVGDTLNKIASRFNTTISALMKLNNITDANLVYVGQVLKIPSESNSAATPVPTAQNNQPAVPAVTGQNGTSQVGYGFDYGIEAFTSGQDIAAITTDISQLGMHWVKQTVYWRDVEPVRGQIDFATLDEIVNRYTSANLKILFTVTTAPAWARSYILENGPSDNLTDYGSFVAALAQRYAGRVQAYEIWNEPNRRSEWSCTESTNKPSFCKAKYSDLLAIAYANIKAVDANAVVVSAGLAPTGYNDGINAVDDRIFLKDLYAAGLANMSDAVGAHPLGWANPPDSACCEAAEGVTTHFDNPSFYFRNTLDDYRKIIVDSKDSSTPIWVTKFGWGTSEDTNPPDKNNVFVSYTDLQEQANYDSRAFELGTELGFIGPMFLSNLNGCQGGGDVESCYYSLISPTGSPRPVFGVLANRSTSNGAQAVAPSIPVEPTVESTALPLDETQPETTPEG